MSDITLTTLGNSLLLAAPFHPEMPARAREIGGRFDRDSRAWRFDIRDQARVEQLAADFYGYLPDATGETCTVRVTLTGYAIPQEVRFAGRVIARRYERDYAVRLPDNVVIVDGRFPARGGSRANPAIGECDGVVLEIRDLPVEALEAETTLAYEIVDGDPLAALRDERERLLARVAEIEQLLGGAA